MAATNHERVGKTLELLRVGLGPFIERESRAAQRDRSLAELERLLGSEYALTKTPLSEWDLSVLLRTVLHGWSKIFHNVLGQAERGFVTELRDYYDRWNRGQQFSGDDTYRALDSAGRLLSAISAPQVAEVDRLKMELLRVRFDEQARTERRRSAGVAIESNVSGKLKPWREVVTPHRDVASGRYQQAEFAADLWQVHLGEGTDEYREPAEFFRRTYLTDSLKGLLVGAVRRLSGIDGDPVVQLQTNFGGGKTHSMLALYHLFSGTSPQQLAGIETVLGKAGAENLPSVRRIVLVGNRISPGNPVTKPDGTLVRTLWGELAYQLGGSKAYARVAADDERATSPGDTLRELLQEYGPCLVLIDEWVAYARQLHDTSDLPAGSFETQFTFAQLLTESAKNARNCLVVISLPASDMAGSPHTQADDIEVGGRRGREALDRLRNVIGRLESSWRPASAEEGFEIVRRRLFEPLTGPQQYKDRDVVAKGFVDFYRANAEHLPPECRDADYEKRIRAAYPIHPEVFDRLYTDWSTLVKFQRTRGVLRLMAAAIHSLWQRGDQNPLILPAHISIDDPRVGSELTRYLSDNWAPIIERDIDGPNSLPVRLDGELPHLGKLSACRRVARTVFLGSAPTLGAAHIGIEERRIKLGSAMPGESLPVFENALRRLASSSTYLYADGARYWYSTQPTVTKIAEDRAEQLTLEHDKVVEEIEGRVKRDVQNRGDFGRVHPFPSSPQDVPDDDQAKLVVLGTTQCHSRDPGSPAEAAAQAILEFRGPQPRQRRNTLVFLAADRTRMQDLDEAVRRYLAWASIVAEKDTLNLSSHQVKQAETQLGTADSTVSARIPEAYRWLFIPAQATPQEAVSWQAAQLSGQEPLAVRASKKLRSDELLITRLAGTSLRMELDRIPLWRENHVSVRQLAEDFACYPYLPRLKDSSVLVAAVRDGLALLTWEQETFAFADGYDEATGRYRGLRSSQHVDLFDSSSQGLLVKPEAARRQMDLEEEERRKRVTPEPGKSDGGRDTPPGPTPPAPPPPPEAKRYHGSVELDSARVGRDASKIADEVIAHLAGIVGASVRVTLEIQADLPPGVTDGVVRAVNENSRALKFSSFGFEKE